MPAKESFSDFFHDYLEDIAQARLRTMVLHKCCMLLPDSALEDHKCPGLSPHWEFVLKRLIELTDATEEH